MKRQDQGSAPAAEERQPTRRGYVRPELTELGSIQELTRGATGTSPDGGFGRFKT